MRRKILGSAGVLFGICLIGLAIMTLKPYILAFMGGALGMIMFAAGGLFIFGGVDCITRCSSGPWYEDKVPDDD